MEFTHKSPRSKRRPLNVSISHTLAEEAKRLDINISRVAEEGLAREVKREKERRWREENQSTIAAYNAWVEKHGLLITPLWMRNDGTI
jgi:antitoxin CcdA